MIGDDRNCICDGPDWNRNQLGWIYVSLKMSSSQGKQSEWWRFGGKISLATLIIVLEMKVYALFADSIQVVPYLYSMNLQLATYKCLLSISMSTSQSIDMDHLMWPFTKRRLVELFPIFKPKISLERWDRTLSHEIYIFCIEEKFHQKLGTLYTGNRLMKDIWNLVIVNLET